MSERICSKVPCYGHEKEGSWPPLEPSGDRGWFVYDEGKEAQVNIQRFGTAPFVIQDSITPFRHGASGLLIDSKSKLRDTDKACGTITTDKQVPVELNDAAKKARIAKELREDRRQAREKAIAALAKNEAPIQGDERAMAQAKERNQFLANALGMDSFKHNGKDYKLK